MSSLGDNLFTRIFRFLTGYVTITVHGFFLEKFTNLCVVNNLPFWDIKRYGNAKLVGRTTIRGFKQMRFQAKKCGCRVSLGRKRGTPFFLHRYRKRKIFVVGIVLFFICIKVTGLFVLDISVTGNEKVSKKEILAQMEELGLRRFVMANKVDSSKLANQFMVMRDDLRWVGIDVDGIRVNIKVVEKEEVPEKVDENIRCNIVSKKPGLIVSIDTYQGTPVVKAGDVVDKGNILVSGIIEMKQFPEKTQFVHALADIKAKVWYEETKSFNFSKLRPKEEMEEFAYKLAHQTAMKNIKEDTQIINTSKSVSYAEDKVIVTVTIEAIEDIGIKEVF